jgi:hypothetical protein
MTRATLLRFHWHLLRWHVCFWLMAGVLAWLFRFPFGSIDFTWPDGIRDPSVPLGIPVLAAVLGARIWLDDLKPGRREYLASLPLSLGRLFLAKLFFGLLVLLGAIALYLFLAFLDAGEFLRALFGGGPFPPASARAWLALLGLSLLTFLFTSLFALQFRSLVNARQAGVPGFFLGVLGFLGASELVFESWWTAAATCAVLLPFILWTLLLLFREQAPVQSGEEVKTGHPSSAFWGLFYGMPGKAWGTLGERILGKERTRIRPGPWAAALVVSVLVTFIGWGFLQSWAKHMVAYEPLSGWPAILLVLAAPVPFCLPGMPWLYRDSRRRGVGRAASLAWSAAGVFPLGWIFWFFTRPEGTLLRCVKCNRRRQQTALACPFCGSERMRLITRMGSRFSAAQAFILSPWPVFLALSIVVIPLLVYPSDWILGRGHAATVRTDVPGVIIFEDGRQVAERTYTKKFLVRTDSPPHGKGFGHSDGIPFDSDSESVHPGEILKDMRVSSFKDLPNASERCRELFGSFGVLTFRTPEGDVGQVSKGEGTSQRMNLDLHCDGDSDPVLSATLTLRIRFLEMERKIDALFDAYRDSEAPREVVEEWARKSEAYWHRYNDWLSPGWNIPHGWRAFYDAMVRARFRPDERGGEKAAGLLHILKEQLDRSFSQPNWSSGYLDQYFGKENRHLFRALCLLPDPSLGPLMDDARGASSTSAYSLLVLAWRRDPKLEPFFREVFEKRSSLVPRAYVSPISSWARGREDLVFASAFGLSALGDPAVTPLLVRLRKCPDDLIIKALRYSRSEEAARTLEAMEEIGDDRMNRVYLQVTGVNFSTNYSHQIKESLQGIREGLAPESFLYELGLSPPSLAVERR